MIVELAFDAQLRICVVIDALHRRIGERLIGLKHGDTCIP